MTYESRVLAVLDDTLLTNQGQVIRATRMAPSSCISALKQLEELGIVERMTVRRGPGAGSGRPAFLYRRRRQTQEAA